MAAVYYTKQAKEYIVSRCTVDEVLEHYSIVEPLVTDVTPIIYKDRMIASIEQGFAFKVTSGEQLLGFLYLVKNRYGEGVSIWGAGDKIASMLLFKEAFTDFPSHKVIIMPHGDNAAYMKAITLGASIRNFWNHGSEIVVVLKDADAKFRRMYEQLGISNG